MASPFPLIIFFLLLAYFMITSPVSKTKTHLHFYFHDIGSNRTAIRIDAEAPFINSSNIIVGAVVMIDDPLTEEPDPGSKLIGSAQGIYAFRSRETVARMMVVNFSFFDGEYNGSTLSVLGRYAVMDAVMEEELPVIGGSGKFTFASGYVVAKTHQFDQVTGNVVVEYDVHVVHQ